MKCVLNECKPPDELQNQKTTADNPALRFYPVVPSNGRIAVKDTVLPCGGGTHGEYPLFIPKGAIVGFTPYVMHRRQDIYGPDALEFRPERWAPEKGLRPGWYVKRNPLVPNWIWEQSLLRKLEFLSNHSP